MDIMKIEKNKAEIHYLIFSVCGCCEWRVGGRLLDISKGQVLCNLMGVETRMLQREWLLLCLEDLYLVLEAVCRQSPVSAASCQALSLSTCLSSHIASLLLLLGYNL